MFVLSACTEVDNEEFYNEYTNSDYHSCPSITNMLIVCKIQYSTDGINYHDLTDGQSFSYGSGGVGSITNIKIIFNVPYLYDSSQYNEVALIENNSNILFSNNSLISTFPDTNFMFYNLAQGRGNFNLTVPAGGSAITTSSGAPIKKGKTISYSVR